MVDPTVIQLVKEKNNAAFKRMYQSCIRYVHAIVRRYVNNESDHADVIQEIFARVFLKVHTFDANKGSFKSWLRRLSINQCLKNYHKQKNFARIVPIDTVENTSEELMEQFSTLSIAEIEQYLNKMPQGYKQIFMLVVIDEYTHKEVGELLNISPETSRSQLFRAKKWLKKNFLNNNHKISASGR